MKQGWKEISLKEICRTQYGYTASATDTDKGVKFVRITDIVPAFIDWNSVPFCEISEKDFLKYKLNEGDLVVARTGATVGYAKQIRKNSPNAVFASYLVKLIPSEKVDKSFLGILVESNVYKEFIQAIAGGSAQPNANANDLTLFKFRIPPLPTQQRIASILSAYDDLIDVNNQRIKLLEQTARELYKEWFVRMRFPGYKQAKFVKGVPVGWEVGKIGNLYEVKSGFAFKGDLLGTEGYPVIKITNIQNGNIDLDNCDRYSGELNKRIEKFELFEGDLLIAMTGAQIGKVGLVSSLKERYFLNQRVGKFFPKKEFLTNNAFAYFTSNTEYFQTMIENYGMGAAQPNISGEQIERVNCIIPSDGILIKFTSICESIFQQTAILKTQNTQLRQIRDRLLPRLISGKLEVKQLNTEAV